MTKVWTLDVGRGTFVTSPNTILFLPFSSATEAGAIANNYRKMDFGPFGSTEAHWLTKIPSNWDSSKKIKIWMYGWSNTAGTGSYRLEFGVEYKKNGEVIEDMEVENITWTETAPSGDSVLLETTYKEFNNALSEADDLMNITVRRLGADAADTRAGAFSIIGIKLEIPLL